MEYWGHRCSLIHCTAKVFESKLRILWPISSPNYSNDCLCVHQLSLIGVWVALFFSTTLWSSLPAAMQPTLEMLISDHFTLLFPTYVCHDARGAKNQAVAQAVTSWNEWSTYKGVSVRISAPGEKSARQKYTREQSVTVTGWPDGLPSDERGQVELQYVGGFSKGWVENHNMSCRMIERGPGRKL